MKVIPLALFSIKMFANKILLEPIEYSESTSDLVPLAVLLDAVIDQRYLPTCRLSDTGSTDHDLPLPSRPLFSNERYLRSSSTSRIQSPRQYYATRSKVLDLRHSISLWKLLCKISAVVTIVWLQGFIRSTYTVKITIQLLIFKFFDHWRIEISTIRVQCCINLLLNCLIKF